MNRRGFTITELLISFTIVAMVAANISMVLRTTSSAYEAGVFAVRLEDQAEQTIDRISYALMSSKADELNPDLVDGMHASHIRYQMSLGVEADGEFILSDVERIALVHAERSVVWSENPDEERERRVVWTRNVAPYQQGEVFNGLDDNGNGLTDEEGLCFDKLGSSVRIRLLLEGEDSKGTEYSILKRNIVTCRN